MTHDAVPANVGVLCAGSQETAVVLQILYDSMQPLLAALQAWLYDGLLHGSLHNFFICEGGHPSEPDCSSVSSSIAASKGHERLCSVPC